MRTLRRVLDALYLAGGILGAGFLLAILVLIVLQMGARWSGLTFPGSASYAGYCMAASAFFALAHTLDRGTHIRVTLVLTTLGRWRRFAEIWCYGIAALTVVFFARYAIKMTWWSWKFGDVSQGQDAMPLWIPQSAMAVGACLFAVAMIDQFLRVLLTEHEGVPDGAGEASE